MADSSPEFKSDKLADGLTGVELKDASAAAINKAAERGAGAHSPIDEGALNLVNICVQSAVRAGAQEPLTAGAQVINHLAGHEVLAAPQWFEATNAQLGTKAWFAETIGTGLGMVVPFVVTEK